MANPYSSSTFESIWLRHFKPLASAVSFDFIKGPKFYKIKHLPVYVSLGKNLTKGNYYELTQGGGPENKVLLLYDIPSYFNISSTPDPLNGLGVYKSTQYPGYLINLNEFSGLDDYLRKTFSRGSRMKLRKYYKRLETSFAISTKMYSGNLDKGEYHLLFDKFLELLTKRFSEKEIDYNNIQPKEWKFYEDAGYSLIQEKKASLFVVYDGDEPIAITYNYHFGDTLVDVITVFDTDYSKFNLGYVNNLKLIEWALENGLYAVDFSKGYFDYKKRLSNLEYYFEYHIIYDTGSPVSKLIAMAINFFFEAKKYLRNKGINILYQKLTYKLKHKRSGNLQESIEYSATDVVEPVSDNLLERIDVKEEQFNFLIPIVYEYLFLNEEAYREIAVSRLKDNPSQYLIRGQDKNTMITIQA
jgi:hypothetical protein